MSKTDIWFAWRPVRTGAMGGGKWVWLKKVWRNRTFYGGMWIAIYQELPIGFYDIDGNYRVPE